MFAEELEATKSLHDAPQLQKHISHRKETAAELEATKSLYDVPKLQFSIKHICGRTGGHGKVISCPKQSELC